MGEAEYTEITRLLRSSGRSTPGDAAGNALFRAVYRELHSIAQGLMARQRGDHTLQPTALVHEAYLRIFRSRPVPWRDRVHFYATAARAMRQTLVDHARKRAAGKRGGGWTRVELDPAVTEDTDRLLEVLALDDALSELSRLDPRMGRVVEMRFFAGMTAREVAGALDVSKRTVDDDWSMARAWLNRRLGGADMS